MASDDKVAAALGEFAQKFGPTTEKEARAPAPAQSGLRRKKAGWRLPVLHLFRQA
jgi:hypothetical protein